MASLRNAEREGTQHSWPVVRWKTEVFLTMEQYGETQKFIVSEFLCLQMLNPNDSDVDIFLCMLLKGC